MSTRIGGGGGGGGGGVVFSIREVTCVIVCGPGQGNGGDGGVSGIRKEHHQEEISGTTWLHGCQQGHTWHRREMSQGGSGYNCEENRLTVLVVCLELQLFEYFHRNQNIA